MRGGPAPVTLFTGLRARTLDPARPQATALAVAHGRVLAVGDDAALQAAFPRHRRVDCGGWWALPALSDSHIHLLAYGLSLRRLDLRECRSLADAVAAVAAAARQTPPGAWVLGRGWDRNRWAEGRWPTRDDLDPVSGGHPVALTSKDGHLLWVNSAALAAAGIDARTPDPPGGEIVRDAAGRPTGLLKEEAKAPVARLIERPDPATAEAAVQEAVRALHRFGVAAVHDMEGPEAFTVLQEGHAGGRLRLRVWMTVPLDRLEAALALGLRTGTGDAWLRVGGVKIFADGTLGSQTASMLEPFDGQPGNTGIAIHDREALRALVGRAVEGGWWPVVHAIGDRANRDVLDAFAVVRDLAEVRGVRCRIEHAQLLHPDDLPRLAALGVIASMQPIHAIADREIADRYWGRRSRWAYAWRSLLDAGTVLAFGSDAPVETPDPWEGLYAAVARRRPGEAPWYPEEAITPLEALRAYTVGAALAAGTERWAGRLAPGCLADFILTDRDVLGVPPEALRETRVLATVVGGEVVFAQGPLAGLEEAGAGLNPGAPAHV